MGNLGSIIFLFDSVSDVKNTFDEALERLSWTYSNNNETTSKTIDQDQVVRIKQAENEDDTNENKLTKARTKTDDEKKINIQHGRAKPDSNETTVVLNESNVTPNASPVNNSPVYIGLISAALTIIIFFSSCTIFLMKQRGRNKVALLQKHTALLCSSPAPGITINTKDIKLPTSIVANNLSQSRLSLKSKLASSDDYKFDANEKQSIYEKINKLPSEQHAKCEAKSSYKPEHFGVYEEKRSTFFVFDFLRLDICVRADF